MADLVTLDRVKIALGIPTSDTSEDLLLIRVIAAASAAVKNYTDRDFGDIEIQEQRLYEYDNSGYLSIDDAASVVSVTFSSGGVDSLLAIDQWQAMPLRATRISYLILPNGYGVNTEMGFTRNLDTAYFEGRFGRIPQIVKVTAVFGWPTVPEDVQQAAIWTAVALKESPQPYITESIEGYSRTVGNVPAEAIPERAKELLTPYVRLKV